MGGVGVFALRIIACVQRVVDGVRSRNGKYRTLRIGKRTERTEFAPLDLFALSPGIIAGQIDVFPAQGRQVRQQSVIYGLIMRLQTLHRSFQIDGIP